MDPAFFFSFLINFLFLIEFSLNIASMVESSPAVRVYSVDFSMAGGQKSIEEFLFVSNFRKNCFMNRSLSENALLLINRVSTVN